MDASRRLLFYDGWMAGGQRHWYDGEVEIPALKDVVRRPWKSRRLPRLHASAGLFALKHHQYQGGGNGERNGLHVVLGMSKVASECSPWSGLLGETLFG